MHSLTSASQTPDNRSSPPSSPPCLAFELLACSHNEGPVGRPWRPFCSFPYGAFNSNWCWTNSAGCLISSYPQHLRAGKLLRLREQAASTLDPASWMSMAPVWSLSALLCSRLLHSTASRVCASFHRSLEPTTDTQFPFFSFFFFLVLFSQGWGQAVDSN